MPPPNMSDRPPPRPECKRTRRISIRATITWITTIVAVSMRAELLDDRSLAADNVAKAAPKWTDAQKSFQERAPAWAAWTMRAKSSGSSDAPPTRAPSMSGWPSNSAALPPLTDPPYWIRTAPEVAAPEAPSTTARMAAQTAWASSGVALAGADGPDGLVGDHQP